MNQKTAKLLKKYTKKNDYHFRSAKKEYLKMPAPERVKLKKEMFRNINYG